MAAQVTNHRTLLPYRRGQLPRQWTLDTVGSYKFGFLLGLGIASHVTSGLICLAFLLAFTSGDLLLASIAGALFGLTRAVAPLAGVLFGSTVESPGEYLVKIRKHSRKVARLVDLGAAAAVAALSATWFL